MNFIIFNPDEMRAESVGCYGHPLVRTPNIDRLAAEGVRFDQAHVQHTVCTPSRCSFMTGWYPHVSGHRTLWHALRPHEPNLLKYLRQAGYEIAWFGKNDLLAREEFATSTDIAASPGGTGHRLTQRAYGEDHPAWQSFLNTPTPGTVDELHDMAAVECGIEFLRQPHDRPFVLYLPLSYPHCPYTAPQPFYDMYDPEALPELRPAGLEGKPSFHGEIRRRRRLDEVDPGILRKLNAVYLGMISAMDEMLGRLLRAVDEAGLSDDTTILFFSDHGDWAGDYGLVEKWPSGLEDCLTRVPLVIRAPGGRTGHVVKEPNELHDIFATVMELAGVEPQHTHFARSLVPQIRGAAGDPDRAVLAEGGYDPHEPHCFEGRPVGVMANWTPASNPYFHKGRQQQEVPASVCRSTMIRTTTHKLVRRTSGEHELYDLAADPLELRNVHDDPSHDATRRRLTERMLDWLIHTSDVVPWNEDPRQLPPPTT